MKAVLLGAILSCVDVHASHASGPILVDFDIFDVEDATFGESGKVGLWTKADSVTAFDDLKIEAIGNP